MTFCVFWCGGRIIEGKQFFKKKGKHLSDFDDVPGEGYGEGEENWEEQY